MDEGGSSVSRGVVFITLLAILGGAGCNSTTESTGSSGNSDTPPSATYTLTVSINGGGTVSSSPAGINCGTSCSAGFSTGTSVTLTATPNSSYTFGGWSGGGCAGTGSCTVAMSAARSVTATFTYSGATSGITIALDESVTLVPQVKRLGLNLGGHNYWDQAQFMKSVINGNPGFEGITHNVTVYCDTGTSGNTCVRATLAPNPAWGDSGSILTGYWNGASYEIITGSAKGHSGTVTTHIGGTSGSSWTLSDTGLALAVGDYLVLRREYPGTGLKSWWNNVSGGGAITVETGDLPPGTQGTQALRLNQLAAGSEARVVSYFDSGGGVPHPVLKLSGPYTLKFKAKVLSGNNQVRVSVSHGATLFNQTFTLNGNWQEYTGTFIANEDGTVHATGALNFSPQGQTEILLDDLTLTKDLADTTNPTVFADSAVNALREYNPGILRYWGRQLGDTIDNQLATPLARKSSGNSNWTDTGDGWEYSLHEFLELCEVLDAEPWYVIPNSTSTLEMAHLMEYLGGGTGTPYGGRRSALGHPAPWTGVFSKIHIEFGNENWNSIFGGIEYPISYGVRGNDLFAVAKASSVYSANPARFNFVLGGQSVYLGRNQQIHNASANHDSFSIAPYMMSRVDNFANNEELYGALFAEAERHSAMTTTPDGSATALGNYNSLQASSHPVALSIYEDNLHTTNGDIDQATLDSFTPSLGAGLGVSSQMLQMMRGMNVVDQMLFSFAQESFRREDNKSVKLWGTIVDHGITNRKRPQFLAAQLANTVLRGSMRRTAHEGSDPTWNQPLLNGAQLDNAHYLQSFFLVDGVRRGLIVYNLHRTSALDVNFSGTHAPRNTVSVNRLTGPAITATNETAANVVITPQSYASFDPNVPFTLPPHSMTVLKWTTDGSPP